MLTIDALRAFGADTAAGLGRCMNNESFYLRLVGMALSDGSFDRLSEAVAAGDGKAAFEAAHSLKGVLGNLSLTPLFEPASAITELLRTDSAADVTAPLEELRTQWQALKKLAE